MANPGFNFFTKHPMGVFLKIMGSFLNDEIIKERNIKDKIIKKDDKIFDVIFESLMNLVPNFKSVYNDCVKPKYQIINNVDNIKLKNLIYHRTIYMTHYENKKKKLCKKASEHAKKSYNLKPFIKNAFYAFDLLQKSKYKLDGYEWFIIMTCDIDEFEKKRRQNGLKKALLSKSNSVPLSPLAKFIQMRKSKI
jgi:hypothetical protein